MAPPQGSGMDRPPVTRWIGRAGQAGGRGRVVLECTFLGHQGWMFATAGARILVDALLVEPFGHGGGVGVVWPPRQLDIAAMPSADAAIFTHEHEDHFNIPSVNRLSRDIPVYIPERSSSAMRQFLQEAGFTVHTLVAGQTLQLADLQFTVFTPDHVRHDEQDEWETMPFLVQDTKDGGSYFSAVDVTVSAAMEAQLRQRGVAPGLWCYANNVMNMSFQEMPPRRAPAQLPIIARFIADHISRPPPPLASVMCGGGFSFTGSRKWMNNAFFALDSEILFDSLQKFGPEERFIAPAPGGRITVAKDRIVSVEETSPFLRTPPKDQWPDRSYTPAKATPGTVEPASGRMSLQPGELEELTERLVAFAEFLYGTPLFRALYSMPGATKPRARFAISAVSDNADHMFEYDPSAGRFQLLTQKAQLADYAGGMECFASDLLDFLRGKLAPSALMFGRLSRWRGGAENLIPAIDRAIWVYGHPLRRQAQHLGLYRSLYALEPKETPKVKARKR
jgi:hypothetical protein